MGTQLPGLLDPDTTVQPGIFLHFVWSKTPVAVRIYFFFLPKFYFTSSITITLYLLQSLSSHST